MSYPWSPHQVLLATDLNAAIAAVQATATSVIATGSPVSRTFANRAADWINVLDFGAALGSGTTDDTAAFQAALNAADLGQTIYVPKGHATVTSLTSPRPTVGNLWRLNGLRTSGGSPLFSIGGLNDVIENYASRRLIISRGVSASTDFATCQFSYTMNHTTGSGVSGNLYSNTQVSSTPSMAAWNFQSILNNSTTGGGGNHTSAYIQCNRLVSGASSQYGCVIEGRDTSGEVSPTHGFVSAEIDLIATGADANGMRIMLDGKIGKQSGASMTASRGYRLSASGGDLTVTMNRAFTTDTITIGEAAFDCSGATLAAGAKGLWLGDNQPIAFDTAGNKKLSWDGTSLVSTANLSAPVLATGSSSARDLKLRFAERVNVKDYGATGDGTTNDTTAIQAAATAISSTGGELWFPAGTYLVSAPITLKSTTYVRGAGAASQLKLAAAGSWSGGNITAVFVNASWPSSGQTNITIDSVSFSAPYGSYGGAGYCHIIELVGTSNVIIRNCTSDGGGDFVALQGCSNTLVEGCTITNVTNAAIDHWASASNARVIGNYCTSWASAGAGLALVQFTGFNTDGTAATTVGFECVGNQLVINNGSAPQAIVVNGHASSGTDDKVVIAHNRVVINAQAAWGVLVTGKANNGIIEGNTFEGCTGSYAAIGVFTPATNWTVADNRVVGWTSSASGVIQADATGCSIHDNHGASCSSPFLGTFDATTISYGNDTGTGTLTLNNVAIGSGSATLTSVTTGALSATGNPTFGWNGAGGLIETLNGAAGTSRYTQINTAGVLRWAFGADSTAEAGANAGTDFFIWPQSDAGAWNATAALAIKRSNSAATFGGNVGFNGTAAIAKPSITGSRDANAALASLLTALASYGLVTDSTTV